MGISGNTITAIIHLTHQDLHINIAGFGLFQSILEPPLHALRYNLLERRAVLLLSGAALSLHFSLQLLRAALRALFALEL